MAVHAEAAPCEERLESAEDALIDSVVLTQQQAIDAMEATSAAVLAGFDATRRELAEVMAERMRRGLETQRALLDCRSLADIGRVQTVCARDAADQYADETARMLRIGGDIALRAFGARRP